MDAASDDQVEMIATLARGIMAERRGRFLDAACGGDANLRAEVEARLGDASKNDGTVEQPSGALADQVANPELDSIESIALEALSEVPGPPESQPAESKIDAPEDLSIGAYCDQKQLDTFARLRLLQKVCRAIDQDHRRGLIHGGLTPKHIRVFPDGSLQVIPREPSYQPAEGVFKPGYVSPEQVLGEPVTTATDVYQLGVLLYDGKPRRRGQIPPSAELRQAPRSAELRGTRSGPISRVPSPVLDAGGECRKMSSEEGRAGRRTGPQEPQAKESSCPAAG